MNTPNSIFTNIPQSSSSQNEDNQIEKKFSSRAEVFASQDTHEDINEHAISKELSLKKDERERRFKDYRLKQKIKLDNSLSIQDRLNISPSVFEEASKMKVEAKDLQLFISHFRSTNIEEQYLGSVGLRKILSIAHNPPIQEIIDFGLVSEFIKHLDHQYPEFQFEALWCLTNIATGTSDQANAIVSKGGLNKIISLIGSKIQEIQEQAIWAMGNLAGDSVKIRDRIIHQKGFENLVKILSTAERPSLIKQCVWAISNFCRTKPPMDYALFVPAIDLLFKAIYKLEKDVEFLVDACWILSFITETYKKAIKSLIELDIGKKLLDFLELPNDHIQLSCLRVIGNLASGNANQTQKIIEWGVLPYLKKILFNEKKNIRKEASWIISNIAAGTHQQLECLIEQDFLPILTALIENDEPSIRKEAVWAVCNLTSTTNKQMVDYMISQQIIKTVCKCLTMKDVKNIAVALEALANLLNLGNMYYTVEGKNLIMKEIEQLGMFETLEGLQFHPIQIIYEKTLAILETYFEVENST